jgi:23S rRNA pseudouridine1911/1915/1917 synthase
MGNDITSRILYLSGACAVVNKLSGEAVEGAGPGMGDLPRLLAAGLTANSNVPDKLSLPTAVHRLDVPVTGCAVFALTHPALRFLNAVFSRDTAFAAEESDEPPVPAVEKQYWAILETPPNAVTIPAAATLRHWVRFDSRQNKSIAYDTPGPGRKTAVLRYRLIGRGRNYLFLAIALLTGRHHQIRAQLARLGLHIKGDLKYGARRSEKEGGIRLHARSLSFPGPSGGGERISVVAEPPLRDNLWTAFEESFNTSAAESGEN